MAIWLNGERFEDAVIPFDGADRGLLLGDGVFDTALVLAGRVAFRDAHLRRLAAGCGALGFPLDMAMAARTMDAVATEIGTGSVRLTVTRGSGPRGLAPPANPRPTILASGASGRPTLAFATIRLWPTTIRRNETSPASRLKTLNYLDAVLALGEARAQGFDDALFLNTRGRVACAGTANVFALDGDRLLTPPIHDGVLPGIMREAVLQLAEGMGLRASEESFDARSLNAADAVFLTNSLRLLAPVSAIGEYRTESGSNPHVGRLARALRETVGRECTADPSSCLPLAEAIPPLSRDGTAG